MAISVSIEQIPKGFEPQLYSVLCTLYSVLCTLYSEIQFLINPALISAAPMAPVSTVDTSISTAPFTPTAATM